MYDERIQDINTMSTSSHWNNCFFDTLFVWSSLEILAFWKHVKLAVLFNSNLYTYYYCNLILEIKLASFQIVNIPCSLAARSLPWGVYVVQWIRKWLVFLAREVIWYCILFAQEVYIELFHLGIKALGIRCVIECWSALQLSHWLTFISCMMIGSG